jgi:23S rRNA pseudouridine2605 synthase
MRKRHEGERERLNKVIAMAGIASRRQAEKIISSGRVTVNGKVVIKAGSKAIWGVDTIAVDGQQLPDPPKKIYLILNKPFGYVTSLHDPQGRPIVRDLVKDVKERIYPVGRLDFDSRGLLILTNDGELSFRLMHPRYEIPKTYKVLIEGSIAPQALKRLKQGVVLDDGPVVPARVRLMDRQDGRSVLRITMFEGRNRQIRRMLEALGHKTLQLIRIEYGNLALGNLKVGKYRYLTITEIKTLRTSVGLD